MTSIVINQTELVQMSETKIKQFDSVI